jgi:hypothetical protein
MLRSLKLPEDFDADFLKRQSESKGMFHLHNQPMNAPTVGTQSSLWITYKENWP